MRKELSMLQNIEEKNQNNIVIYQTDDGKTKIDVKFENETVWLSQQQMADLFKTPRTNIVDHINNIYKEEELEKDSTCRKFRQVRLEGNKNVNREIPYYNLDMIISLLWLQFDFNSPYILWTIFKNHFQDYSEI